jgi:Holliday junction resolvasome RuvABC DNA-binding subunit
MHTNLTKREFLQLSSVGGVAAVMGLLTGTTAEATRVSTRDILAELAEAITAISYIGGLAFVVAAIFKFKQHKDNPTQDPHNPLGLISAAWVLIDDSTVTSLTDLGYSPQFLADAVEQAKDGDTSNLLAFFSDLNLLA